MPNMCGNLGTFSSPPSQSYTWLWQESHAHKYTSQHSEESTPTEETFKKSFPGPRVPGIRHLWFWVLRMQFRSRVEALSEYLSGWMQQAPPLWGGSELNWHMCPCLRMPVYCFPHRIIQLSLPGFPEPLFSVHVAVYHNVSFQRIESAMAYCNDHNANLRERIKHLLEVIKGLNIIDVAMKTAT